MRRGREVQKCVNEWVNACSKEDKTQKDRQGGGGEERMKINGRQVLGVMRKTCKTSTYCVMEKAMSVRLSQNQSSVKRDPWKHCKSINEMSRNSWQISGGEH